MLDILPSQSGPGWSHQGHLHCHRSPHHNSRVLRVYVVCYMVNSQVFSWYLNYCVGSVVYIKLQHVRKMLHYKENYLISFLYLLSLLFKQQIINKKNL